MLSQPRLVALLVGLALLGSGGAVATAQYYTLSEYQTTTGTVERAEIRNVTSPTAQNNLSLITGGSSQLYAPDVTYRYTVEGETYTGENVAFGTEILVGDRRKLAATLDAVRPGLTTVYYDPDHPGDAHLLQRLDFFPAGVLALFGLLVVTDALTPRPRVVRALTSLVPIETLERTPGVRRTLHDAAENPMAILASKRVWSGVDPAPFRGRAGAAIWVLCYLFITDLVVAYFLLSSPPYDLWALGAGVVVVAGLARLGFDRLTD